MFFGTRQTWYVMSSHDTISQKDFFSLPLLRLTELNSRRIYWSSNVLLLGQQNFLSFLGRIVLFYLVFDPFLLPILEARHPFLPFWSRLACDAVSWKMSWIVLALLVVVDVK